MCYSALIWTDFRRYQKAYAASLDIHEFVRLIERRLKLGRLAIPKGMLDSLGDLKNVSAPADAPIDQVAAVDELITLLDEVRKQEAATLEELLFTQKTRLVDAERKLAAKPTKAASESQRIATDKIERAMAKLADLRRTEPKERDSRIFPGHYGLVMVDEGGQRILKPMRYQCRPAGKPAFYDTKYPGTYNARADNLQGFWKGQFGHTHGLMVVTSFFENVNLHRAEGRELAAGEEVRNQVLRFDPAGGQLMLVACLWSHWTPPGGTGGKSSEEDDLLSFAAITDEPPPEVAAAGHDRCIVPIKPENIDAWLNPDAGDLQRQVEILKDRETPYFEHRLAA